MKRRICRVPELAIGEAHCVDLGVDDANLPVQGLVVRTPEGQVRAYINLCKHLPIPLDGGSGDHFDDDRTHLFCGTHGARFRLTDGLCTEGPCEGDHLDAIPIEIIGDEVFLILPDEG